MRARPVYAGDVLLITRRCHGQLARLRPGKAENDIVIYCLARAARRHQIEVIAFVIMSTHLHLVIRDPKRTHPLFCRDFFSTVARAVNFEQETGGYVFSQSSYKRQRLRTAKAIYKEIAYTIANPVAAGCVRSPEQWPGLITLPHQLGRRTFTAPRPEFFRDPTEEEELTGDETARERHRLQYTPPEEADAMRDEETQTLVLPPVLPDEASSLERGDDVRVAAADWLSRELEKVHEERRKAGLRGWVGARQVLRQDPGQPPRPVSGRPTGELSPSFATQDRRVGKEEAEMLRAWLELYAQARGRWMGGDRDVVFPHGTWLAPRLWGATAAAA